MERRWGELWGKGGTDHRVESERTEEAKFGTQVTVPAPVHNILGVTGDSCNDLLALFKDLDSKHHAVEPSPQRTGSMLVRGQR